MSGYLIQRAHSSQTGNNTRQFPLAEMNVVRQSFRNIFAPVLEFPMILQRGISIREVSFGNLDVGQQLLGLLTEEPYSKSQIAVEQPFSGNELWSLNRLNYEVEHRLKLVPPFGKVRGPFVLSSVGRPYKVVDHVFRSVSHRFYVVNLRIQRPLHCQSIGTYRKFHHLLVAFVTSLIASPHLSDGRHRCTNGKYARYQSLVAIEPRLSRGLVICKASQEQAGGYQHSRGQNGRGKGRLFVRRALIHRAISNAKMIRCKPADVVQRLPCCDPDMIGIRP